MVAKVKNANLTAIELYITSLGNDSSTKGVTDSDN